MINNIGWIRVKFNLQFNDSLNELVLGWLLVLRLKDWVY